MSDIAYYELVNPSDQYTLKAADAKVAIFAALALGGGMYPLNDEQGNQIVPLFLGGGLDEWLQEKFGCDLETFQAQLDKPALAECFDSVAICGFTDRRLWDMAVAAMDDPAKREAWLAEWHDVHRSSMNDIGRRAKAYALRARELAAETPVSP